MQSGGQRCTQNLEERRGSIPIPDPRRAFDLLWLVGEICTRRRSFTQDRLSLSRLGQHASLAWVKGEVPSEFKAEMLYDIIRVPE